MLVITKKKRIVQFLYFLVKVYRTCFYHKYHNRIYLGDVFFPLFSHVNMAHFSSLLIKKENANFACRLDLVCGSMICSDVARVFDVLAGEQSWVLVARTGHAGCRQAADPHSAENNNDQE